LVRKAVALLVLLIAAATLLQARAEEGTLADPMRPDYLSRRTTTHQRQTPRWTLTSTLISPDRRLAVINGQTVKVGDTVNGASVVEILPYAVKLRSRGKMITATLLTGDMKRPAQR
jgi:MSHA biogenesis protein MshK